MSNYPVERRSYAQRRELFKDIWKATMLFDDGDAVEVKGKPKVIKTLRLDQSSHEKVSVRKKRLKNLRTVCNKILAFCDRQEQVEHYYHQAISSGKNADNNQLKKSSKTKKKKTVKRIKKPSSTSKENALAKAKDSDRKYRNLGVIHVNRAKPVKRAVTGVVTTMVASQITSKLTSTRSPLRHSSPSPIKHQKIDNKKGSAKKKKSTDI